MVDVNNKDEMMKIVKSTIGTKFIKKWFVNVIMDKYMNIWSIIMVVFRMDLACEMALNAVKTVSIEKTGNQREIDIKRYARVEKIPGGTIEDSEVLQGVMINKDVTHPRMRR